MLLSATGRVIEVFDDNNFFNKVDIYQWKGKSVFAFYPLDIAQEVLKKVSYSAEENVIQFYDFSLNTKGHEQEFHMRIVPLSYRWENHLTVACYITKKYSVKEDLNVIHESKWQKYLLNQIIESKDKLSESALDQAWNFGIDLTRNFSFYVIIMTVMEQD